mmetsp:Transcript_64554/g.172998  ORF Transcript_64554/g.172998 Transcript_64554/m.172998 type:complete len:141 (+) Transcript_64554:113-535(+)
MFELQQVVELPSDAHTACAWENRRIYECVCACPPFKSSLGGWLDGTWGTSQKALVQAGLWQRFFEPLSIRSMDPGPQGQLTKLVMFRDVGKGLVTLERAASALRRTKDGTIKVAKDLLKATPLRLTCAPRAESAVRLDQP